MKITDYTGKLYNFRTYNCWHHVRAVREDAGIWTPTFDVINPTAAPDMFDAGHADSKGLVQVTEPRDYDAVLMGYKHAGRIIWHSGVYYQGYISHCERAAKQVKLESLSDIRKRYTEIELWR